MNKWEAAIGRLLLTWCLASSLLFIRGRHTKQKIALDRTTCELGVILSIYFYVFTIIISYCYLRFHIIYPPLE